MDESDTRRPMAKRITATDCTEVPPRAALIGICLQTAAAVRAGDGGQLAATHGHQVSKRFWLVKHGSALRALNTDRR